MSEQSMSEARDIVDEYARASEPQLPEKALLELLKHRLPQMIML